MRARGRIAIAAAVLAAAGCGDDGGSESGPAFDDLPQLFAARVCTELNACLDERTQAIAFGEGGCEERLTAQLEDGDFAYVQDAIEAGRVTYDASSIEPCLAQIEGVGCGFVTTRVFAHESCESAFQGSVELDEDCSVDAECIGNAFCRLEGACPGTCSELLGPGDPCTDDDQCEEGLACSDDATCAAPAEEGNTCGGDVAGECTPDLACIGSDDETGAAGTCTNLDDVFAAELGAPCDFDAGELCGQGLSCVVDSISGTTAEILCARPVGSGEDCKFGVPSQCPMGEYCADTEITAGDYMGTCEALPEAGETCVAVPGSPACTAGLICDIDNRCYALNRLGQPCASDDGCASENCMAGTCERPELCEL